MQQLMQQRLTHRAILVTLLLCSIALTACGSSSTQPRIEGAPVAMEPTGASTTVNVTVEEFAYVLDKTEANAGATRFIVQNIGTMPHDFVIQGNGVEQATSLLDPGQSTAI
jgi:hypothetical protein